jgi:hypothetical protein
MCGCAGDYYFGDLIGKSLAVFEELWIVESTCDDYKSILSGYPISINVKHVTHRQILTRVPCLITGNTKELGKGFLNPIDEAALKCRIIEYEFRNVMRSPTTRILPVHVANWLLN